MLKNIKNKLNLRYEPMSLKSKTLAENCAAHCIKTHMLILGENDRFWVVCPSDFSRLLKAGYEAA